MQPRFYLKKPNDRQRSFSLYKQIVLPNGKTKNETIKVDDLEALNIQLKQNKVKLTEAFKIAEVIRQRMNVDIGAEEIPEAMTQPNARVLKRYWEHEYSGRYLEDEQSAYNKLECAVRALGDVSISTATREQISGKIKACNKSVNIKRTYLQKLNQILKYLNRGFTLNLPKEEREEPHFLTDAEFERVLEAINNDTTKILARVAYHTGARASEIMWIDSTKLVTDRELLIEKQIDRKTKRPKHTKNRKARRAYVFAGGADAIREWTAVKSMDINLGSESNRIRKACRKLWPNRKDKHCSLHDLRHSYAGNIVAKTGSLTYAAQCIGDSIQVTEKYYAGFMARTESIDMIDLLVKRAKP